MKSAVARAAVVSVQLWIWLACAGLSAPTRAADPANPADEVTACLKRNLPSETSLQTVQFRARDRIGAERTIRAKVFWKKGEDGLSKVYAQFSEPVDLAGAGFLLLQKSEQNEMFLYMPEVRKVRRVNSQMMKGSVFGTDFSYEDFERLQGMSGQAQLERLDDAELDALPVYRLRGLPPEGSGSAYAAVVTHVDKKTCVPLKIELYEAGERLRKVLTVDPAKVEPQGELFVPRELRMRDLRDETETLLVVETVEIGVKIPDRTFTLTHLERTRGR